MLADIPRCNKASVDKLAFTKDEMKKTKAKAKVIRAQRVEDTTKLEFFLIKIETLKMEVHRSQCEVAFLTKKVETSNSHQKRTTEALEKANLEFFGLKDSNKFYKGQIKHCVRGR